MRFREPKLRLREVIVVVPKRDRGDKDHKPNERVRIYK